MAKAMFQLFGGWYGPMGGSSGDEKWKEIMADDNGIDNGDGE